MTDDELRSLLAHRWRAWNGNVRPLPVRDAPLRAAALCRARRWSEAARLLEHLLRCEGPAGAASLFWLAKCRIELGDARGALEAATLFLELSGETEELAGMPRERILARLFALLKWKRPPLPGSRGVERLTAPTTR